LRPRTIGDAVSYMTALPKDREMQKAWQHACKLILGRAPIEASTRQLSLALFTDAALDLGHKRPRAQRAKKTPPASGVWRGLVEGSGRLRG
jgi:hypothetical protein